MDADIKLLEDRVAGLRLRVGQLKATERIMLQAHGLETQITKAKQEAPAIEADIQTLKEQLAELTGQQQRIINQALNEFALRMEQALPAGKPSIRIENDKVALGWLIRDAVVPFQALSGGERVFFDIALAHAFGADIIAKEVAELDPARLEVALQKLTSIPCQTILSTCHEPKSIPAGWTIVRVGAEK